MSVSRDVYVRRELEDDSAIHSVSPRFRAPPLLLTGTVSALCAFVFAFVIGLMRFLLYRENKYGEPYPSGYGYWPATVSEMIHDTSAPEGRIFFAFSLIAAICIFQSWYADSLRNVYVGPHAVPCTCGSVYWNTFRQFVPMVGLMLLICVPTVPMPEADLMDWFSIALHLVGASMMFVGYLVAELRCLSFLNLHQGGVYLSIEGTEKIVRVCLAFVILVCFVTFDVITVILVFFEGKICCSDRWMNAGQSHDVQGFGKVIATGAHRVDTASSWMLFLKMLSYFSEVVAGLAILMSQLAIWFFCEERHVDYAELSLEQVWEEQTEEDESARQDLDDL